VTERGILAEPQFGENSTTEGFTTFETPFYAKQNNSQPESRENQPSRRSYAAAIVRGS